MQDVKQLAVNAVRMLSAAGVQKANSGHPGLPMGAAPMAFTLWGDVMKHDPSCPDWADRDRFILSAGHGSMLLYSLLHLFGYGLTLEDLGNFRQLGSKTPGHPEYRHTVGIETTTGPLGQGIANGVGFAIAEARLAAEFNREGYPVVDHRTWVLCGDGCMMEGISGEASSLAGTLGLGKLIVLYDDNDISIEGHTDITFTESVPERYKAYGWQVLEVQDGNDLAALKAAMKEAVKEEERPTLIIVHTVIGYGCPAKQGKASAHGEPLGAENLAAAKEFFNWPQEPAFYVPDEVYAYMEKLKGAAAARRKEWESLFTAYARNYPELAVRWQEFHSGKTPDLWQEDSLFSFEKGNATRRSSGEVLNQLAKILPNLFGGSADLAPSNMSDMKGVPYFSGEDRSGSNMHFGVREHAMAAIANGIALHGGLRAYCATFFVFSDYMKHSMRLSALMQLPVIYILTHDSIGVGEDGPTHQPIEHLASLRSIPGMTVYRPADPVETAAAWVYAIENQGPTCLVLTRQNLPLYPGEIGKNARYGGYILSREKSGSPALLLLATGSECELALQTQAALWDRGVDSRVISLPSWEVFARQTPEYRESVIPNTVRARLGIEAAARFGWEEFIGLDGDMICMKGFGASAPAARLFEKFGFTVENAVEKALALLK